jgi:putative phosphoribosyl transferase
MENVRFRDRVDAGRQLAYKLGDYAARHDVLVLALPRGGLPVAFEVARALGAPLDVFVVRKIGVPGLEELAMGAVASGGAVVVNRTVVEGLGVTEEQLNELAEAEKAELAWRDELYRQGRPPLPVRGQTVIVVDDGLATGSTMSAAILALRALEPARIVVAVPVAPIEARADIATQADEVVCVATPESFRGVGQFYEDFRQTSDDEVHALLRAAEEWPVIASHETWP